MITYSVSIIAEPLGDAATGVIRRVPFRLDGTDGLSTAFENGIAELAPIDPASPQFVPLANVTTNLLQQWVLAAIDLPFWQSVIAANISAIQAAPLAQLSVSNLSTAPAAVSSISASAGATQV
jgi:hypothetical protein